MFGHFITLCIKELKGFFAVSTKSCAKKILIHNLRWLIKLYTGTLLVVWHGLQAVPDPFLKRSCSFLKESLFGLLGSFCKSMMCVSI